MISIGDRSEFFEIDTTLSIVWEYDFTGPGGQEFNGKIARAQKYHPTYFDQYLIGDLNSDSIIDILDVVLAVEIILNQDPSDDFNPLADI